MMKAILLDLDGTVFRGKTAIPGAGEALEKLRASGIKIFFLTNANNSTRAGIAKKINGMGIRAYEKEVYTSAYAAADFIAHRHPGKQVFCISSGGIQEEMESRGIRVVENESAQVVVVGYDPTLTYKKLATAFRAIQNGAEFLATNTDATFPVEDGLLPGSGAMVAAVSASTGKKPVVIGKPNRYGIELLLKENMLGKKEALIVGDRIETDILAGKKTGMRTVLVLSGVTKKTHLEKSNEKEKPDFILGSVAGLPRLIKRLNRQ